MLGANDRVRIGVAGLRSRGKSHIDGWLGQKNVQVAYLVDPDRKVLAGAMSKTADKTKGLYTTQGVADLREALNDKDLDAISIATPNHWHSLMTIWGAQAGKHVYVEKPMSHDVVEGRIAVEAQKKYGVVMQHGTQRRSSAGLHDAIHAGKFGKLKISYGYCCKPRSGIGHKPIAPPPDNLDWDLWRGPARIADYHANYVHYHWHWFWATGNGDLMNNQGTHELDIARWAIDKDQTHPVRTMAIGGRFQWNDQGETPNGKVTPGGNWGSFIAAIRANDPGMANGNVVDAHNACVLGHLMNNSYRLGTKVPFNAKAGRFGDNENAHKHFTKLHNLMHQDVGIPEDGNQYQVGPMLTFDSATERHTGEHADAANKLLKDQNRKGFEVPERKQV